jgi:DNA-binding NtrC family response regulator
LKDKGKILIVDDDPMIIPLLAEVLDEQGHHIRIETESIDIMSKIEDWMPDLLLLDINLPGKSGIEILEKLKKEKINLPVVMLTGDDTVETAVKTMKLGAVDYITKPFDIEKVKILVQNLIEKEKLKHKVGYFHKIYSEKFTEKIIGKTAPITRLLAEAERLAKARVPTVLITGESGTGKELIAWHLHQEIHANEPAPFIRVNCAALPETLLETELFGYVKGAFTDAKETKKGLFELADNGCILLDEIGEMKLELQSKLLRVLEERKFRRVAGNEEIPINVTVIATTNQDIASQVDHDRFRLDLFYRLNTFHLTMPPLRERKDDIILIAKHFLFIFAERYHNQKIKSFSKEAEKLIKKYHWPGNIRELKNVIERIVVLQDTEQILPEHLPLDILNKPVKQNTKVNGFTLSQEGINLNELTKEIFTQALQLSDNNKSMAAKLLNMSYESFRYQSKKFGLK